MRLFFITLWAFAILSHTVWAADIHKGATMQVKADSIWFQDVSLFSHWQKLKNENSPELNAFEVKQLDSRNAWAFTKPLPVKIISFDAAANRVNVEMEIGRMKGSIWWLDASALMK
jgi:uncharacterized HAD superfamily protein